MVFPVILIYTSLIWIARCYPTAEKSETSCSSSRLHQAVLRWDVGLLKDVIRSGVDMYMKDCYGLTAMELALHLENERAAYSLLEGSYDVDAADEQGDRILLHAVRRGSRYEVEKLAEFGSTVDFINSNGSTPFLEALISGREEVTEVLLRAGARLDFGLVGGDSYLHKVVDIGDFKTALNLLKFKVILDPENDQSETPLTKAVLKDNPAFVNLLGTRGADINRRNKLGETYLHLAVKGNGIKVLSALVKHGINVDAENNEGETPLFYAAKQNNAEVARALIQSGADSNKSNKKGETSLHLAVMHNSTEVINLLPRNGTNVDAENAQRETPLFYAVKQNNTEVVRALIQSGADLNRLNIDGKSYLDMTRRNKTLMARFLELGVDPDVKDSLGRTIIRGAVEGDDTETMDLLYKHGSDVNQTFTIYIPNTRREENATLLHLAARSYSTKAIEWLVSHGAAINKKAGSYTPLDTAILGYKTESAEKLLELGACEDYEASGCQQSYQLAENYIRGSLASLIHAKRQKPQS